MQTVSIATAAFFHHRLLLLSSSPALPTARITPRHRLRLTATFSVSAVEAAASSITSSAASAAAFYDYQILFASQPAETIEPLLLRASEGSLPADFPVGTYYLTGPGMISDDHGFTLNPLDGHGYLRAFCFAGAGSAVSYSARYVDTEAAREERDVETGKWRFRRPGLFSILKAGEPGSLQSMGKNVANTTVLRWGGRLFCLWEGGLPYELDPSSLTTLGPSDLFAAADGRRTTEAAVNFAVRLAKPFIHGLLGKPSKRTLSHYKIDAQRNRLLVLSCDAEDLFLPQSNFTFYEFGSNFELIQRKEFIIPDRIMVHDWAFTDSHYILLGNRIKFNLPGTFRAIAGFAPMISTLALNPSQVTTPIYLLPRSSLNRASERDWRVPIDAPSQMWASHVGNAYEERDDAGRTEIKIQASVSSYQWFNFERMFGYDWQTSNLDPFFMNAGNQAPIRIVEIAMELDAGGSCRLCSVAEVLTQWKRVADFPVINPANSGKPNRFLYASSTSGAREFLRHFPFDTVIKLDCFNGEIKSWCPGGRKFLGEPIFIGKEDGDEEDGYILVVEYAVSRHMCYLTVLDAKIIGEDDALLAKLEVPENLSFPLGFHGFWDGK